MRMPQIHPNVCNIIVHINLEIFLQLQLFTFSICQNGYSKIFSLLKWDIFFTVSSTFGDVEKHTPGTGWHL